MYCILSGKKSRWIFWFFSTPIETLDSNVFYVVWTNRCTDNGQSQYTNWSYRLQWNQIKIVIDFLKIITFALDTVMMWNYDTGTRYARPNPIDENMKNSIQVRSETSRSLELIWFFYCFCCSIHTARTQCDDGLNNSRPILILILEV